MVLIAAKQMVVKRRVGVWNHGHDSPPVPRVDFSHHRGHLSECQSLSLWLLVLRAIIAEHFCEFGCVIRGCTLQAVT